MIRMRFAIERPQVGEWAGCRRPRSTAAGRGSARTAAGDGHLTATRDGTSEKSGTARPGAPPSPPGEPARVYNPHRPRYDRRAARRLDSLRAPEARMPDHRRWRPTLVALCLTLAGWPAAAQPPGNRLTGVVRD